MENEKKVIKIATTGSVDDGKSTLIGRILFETGAIFDDQLRNIENLAKQKNVDVDYSMLLDGLSSEREQGITIDVAHCYFETPNSKLIIMDSPGHVQYTRNMFTGASSADVSILLIDARNGVIEQTKRHLFILSLIQVPNIILAVNKMDLVNYDENTFRSIKKEIREYSKKLNYVNLSFIPISALKGDNVTSRSENMEWYNGMSVLESIESNYIGAKYNQVDFRMGVQQVIRPNQDYRGYAGQIASGRVKVGDEIMVLPSGVKSSIKDIVFSGGSVDEAFPGDSVSLVLNHELDISNGDLIVKKNNIPASSSEIDTQLLWMSQEMFDESRPYFLKQKHNETKVWIKNIDYKIDIKTLSKKESGEEEKVSASLNDILRVSFESSKTIYFDPYKINKQTGSFILIDSETNETVAAGIIRGEKRHSDFDKNKSHKSENITWNDSKVTQEDIEVRQGYGGVVIWIYGLSGSGKSTLANNLSNYFFEKDMKFVSLDGDNVRFGLNRDLGFSNKDRAENIRRVGEAAKIMYSFGNICICSFISPSEEIRGQVRELFPEGKYIEIFMDTPLDVCEQRDPKNLYKKARSGNIKNMTGVGSSFEAGSNSEIIINDETLNETEVFDLVLKKLKGFGVV